MSTSADMGHTGAASKSESRIQRIGVIGLGHMGSDFAGNLIADGYQVTVYDLNERHVEPAMHRPISLWPLGQPAHLRSLR
jgi:Trk K+ transport system NAD-binding subunit